MHLRSGLLAAGGYASIAVAVYFYAAVGCGASSEPDGLGSESEAFFQCGCIMEEPAQSLATNQGRAHSDNQDNPVSDESMMHSANPCYTWRLISLAPEVVRLCSQNGSAAKFTYVGLKVTEPYFRCRVTIKQQSWCQLQLLRDAMITFVYEYWLDSYLPVFINANEVGANVDMFQRTSVPFTDVLGSTLMMRGFSAATLGSVIGLLVSLVVNVSLVELTISPFFATYFGCLFIAVGCMIGWRVISGQTPDPDERHQQQLLLFAGFVLVSGVLCFLLKRQWLIALPKLLKVPVYTLLGISVAFALTFTLVDIINLLMGLFQSSASKPLVQSASQIRLVLSMAMLMGSIFGTIFGLMDVEDSMSSYIRLAMLREEHYCYPIGAVLGAVAGFCNEVLRTNEKLSWQIFLGDESNTNDFDRDI